MKKLLNNVMFTGLRLIKRYWQGALLTVLALVTASCMDFNSMIPEEYAVLAAFGINIALEIKNLCTEEWL